MFRELTRHRRISPEIVDLIAQKLPEDNVWLAVEGSVKRINIIQLHCRKPYFEELSRLEMERSNTLSKPLTLQIVCFPFEYWDQD